MHENKIKAVLFDLGETILTFGRVPVFAIFRQSAARSYQFLKSCGFPVGNFEYYCWKNFLSIRLNYLLSGISGKDFDSLELLRKITTAKNARLTEDQLKQLVWYWYEPLSERCVVEPNLPQTLAKLRDSGLKLGIITNTFVNACALDKHLEQLGILSFFPVRLRSYEFDFRKPDLRIFQAASQRIGHIPQEIMFVGDRIDNDIKPAIKIGMKAVLKTAYTNIGREVPPGVCRIKLLSELPQLLL